MRHRRSKRTPTLLLPRQQSLPPTVGGPPCSNRSTRPKPRSEEHTSELQSLMRISYAVFCLKKEKKPCSIPSQNKARPHMQTIRLIKTTKFATLTAEYQSATKNR